MFGFLFSYTSLSHSSAPGVIGFLSLLLIYLYFSQVFFLHFWTPGWLFFPSIITGQNLGKFPLFLEAKTLQHYLCPALSSRVAGAKGSGWSCLLQVKGACRVFKRRAPLWWCICSLLPFSVMDTIYAKWILWIYMFWPDICAVIKGKSALLM